MLFYYYLVTGFLLAVCCAGFLYWRYSLWFRLHCHNVHEMLLLDENDVVDLIEEFGYMLSHAEMPSPFMSKDPICETYRDAFGRPVIIKVRWLSNTHFYVNDRWITLLDEVWPPESA